MNENRSEDSVLKFNSDLLELMEPSARAQPDKFMIPIPVAYLFSLLSTITEGHDSLRMSANGMKLLMNTLAGKELPLPDDVFPQEISKDKYWEFLDTAFLLRDDIKENSDPEKVTLTLTGRQVLTMIDELRSSCR